MSIFRTTINKKEGTESLFFYFSNYFPKMASTPFLVIGTANGLHHLTPFVYPDKIPGYGQQHTPTFPR